MGNKAVKVTDSSNGRLSRHSSSYLEYSSGSASGSEGSVSVSIRSNSVHGNLMRNIHRDPLKVYEVVKVLGEGSMGTVAKVRKKTAAIGGSARPEFVKEHSRSKNDCRCFLPFFSFCIPKKQQSRNLVTSSRTGSSRSAGSAVSTTTKTPTPASEYAQRKVFRKTSSLLVHGSKKDLFYALKSIHLDRCSNEEFQLELKNEVAILKELDHPNIVRAIETFQYHKQLFIVLELCNGGDLYSRDPYSELEASRIVGCLLSAVAYLHSKGIVHRDLKFENCMFTDPSKHADVKIIDFGLSKKFAANEFLKDAVGTVYTMAPELIQGHYDSKADIWSLGVLSFMLLSSSMPFYGRTRSQVIKKIMRGKYHFGSRRWQNISDEAIEFVKTLLQSDPRKRPTAEEVMKLNWRSRDFSRETRMAEVEMMDMIQASIHNFSTYGTLKKLGLMVVAYKSTDSEVGFLRRMFRRFDTSQDGEICMEEFSDALREYNYSPEEIDTLFRAIDIDGTGNVHYIEFLAATLEALGSIDEDRLAEAFDRIDCDDSGYITVENLQDFLGTEVPRDKLDRIIDEADLLGQHRISYQEFLELWDGETDALLNASKHQVQQRRIISREPSFVSSSEQDSDDDEFLTEEEMILEGELLFEDQRSLSARGVYV